MPKLVHELIGDAARTWPGRPALAYKSEELAYAELQAQVTAAAGGLVACGLVRGARVAIYLEKRTETVLSIFATSGSLDRVGSVMKAVVPVRIANQDLLTSLGRRVAYQLELTLPSGPERIAVTVRDDFRPRSSTATASFGAGGAADPPGAGPGSE